MRGSVSECLSMRELNTPLGLYLKKLGECTRGGARHNSHRAVGEGGPQEPLALGRPTCGVGRPQGGPLDAPLWPGDSSMVINFENMVHGQGLLENMSKLFFPKDFKTQKIFLVFL